MMMVFFFHCARFFGGGGWHLKNPGEENLIALFIGRLDLWIMPLFFLLSGAGSWFALTSRTAGQYLLERVKKVGWLCLSLGIFGFAAEGTFIYVLNYNYANLDHPGGEPFSLMYVLFNTIMSIASWSWVVFVLSLGAKYLNVKSKLVTYGNEAVLPFYIFH
jgi:hypothetical protein